MSIFKSRATKNGGVLFLADRRRMFASRYQEEREEKKNIKHCMHIPKLSTRIKKKREIKADDLMLILKICNRPERFVHTFIYMFIFGEVKT